MALTYYRFKALDGDGQLIDDWSSPHSLDQLIGALDGVLREGDIRENCGQLSELVPSVHAPYANGDPGEITIEWMGTW